MSTTVEYRMEFERSKKAPSHIAHIAIKYLQYRQPDVFLYGDRIGYVQAWKYGRDFWVECKGVNGEYFTHKFNGDDMINTCETYFSALRTGYPLWEV